MKHYILYCHDGSANHGCEAIVRTTAELLNYKKNRITLASYHVGADKAYGIDKMCDLHYINEQKTVSPFNPLFIKAYCQYKLSKDFSIIEDLYINRAYDAKRGDIALSIGGDNYCYSNTDWLTRSNKTFKRYGIKTVLWGCSINPETLDSKEIVEDLKSFDLITARESISYSLLKEVNNNTILVSDSAFLLNTIKKPSTIFQSGKDFVGLNISPLIEDYENGVNNTRKCYEKLIEYLLRETNMSIILIPHVVFGFSDDRTVIDYLHEKYKFSERVFKINDCNCEELKGYISRCRFFVGARTHATIAAYSSCVPTLVVGYSTKSIGIARDLFGTAENYVVPVQELSSDNDLVNAFNWLEEQELSIKGHLMTIIPEYKNRVYKALDYLNRL